MHQPSENGAPVGNHSNTAENGNGSGTLERDLDHMSISGVRYVDLHPLLISPPLPSNFLYLLLSYRGIFPSLASPPLRRFLDLSRVYDSAN